MKIYKHPARQEFELEKPKPKIGFRIVIELEPFAPNPGDYDIETPLGECVMGQLIDMAKIELQADMMEHMANLKSSARIEILFDGEKYRTVGEDE